MGRDAEGLAAPQRLAGGNLLPAEQSGGNSA